MVRDSRLKVQMAASLLLPPPPSLPSSESQAGDAKHGIRSESGQWETGGEGRRCDGVSKQAFWLCVPVSFPLRFKQARRIGRRSLGQGTNQKHGIGGKERGKASKMESGVEKDGIATGEGGR